LQENFDAGNVSRRVVAIIFIIVGIFAFDRATKSFFLSAGGIQDVVLSQIVPGIVDLTYHKNLGLIADLRVPQWLIIVFTSLVIAVIAWKLVRDADHASYALALILAGALGNLYDRVMMGFVFDWILLFNRSIINIADIAIAFGVAWYILEKSKERNLIKAGSTS
jgi:signal peptidase II